MSLTVSYQCMICYIAYQTLQVQMDYPLKIADFVANVKSRQNQHQK